MQKNKSIYNYNAKVVVVSKSEFSPWNGLNLAIA